MELQNYTMAMEMAVETPINYEAEGALCSNSEELKDIDPQSQGSVDPRATDPQILHHGSINPLV